MVRIKERNPRPSCVDFKYEPYCSDSQNMMPSSTTTLNRRMNLTDGTRRNRLISIRTSKYGSSELFLTNLLDMQAPDRYEFDDYENVYSYFSKGSQNGDEGFIDYNLNTPHGMKDGLNNTFVLDAISVAPTEIPETSPKNKSAKKSVVAALIGSSKSPKRKSKKSGGRLKNLVNLFENLKSTDDDESNLLDTTMTDWKFVNVPEAAPEQLKIIPADQMSPYTPAYFCNVSVRPGKVRQIIDHFNGMNETIDEDNEEPIYSTPIKKKTNIETSMVPGSFEKSRKNLEKLNLESVMVPGSFEKSRANLQKIKLESIMIPGSFEESRNNLSKFMQEATTITPEIISFELDPQSETEPLQKPDGRMKTLRKGCLLRIRSLVRSLRNQH